MSAARHTPGPWVARGTRIYQDVPGIDCICTMQVSNQPNWDGDARLIAAAPELLHTLLIALPYVEDAQADPCYKPGAVATVVRQMRAAIAQADPSAGVTA